ncbi:uncharacterized protein LOC100372543 [Saccoglossus kowalevskii]|uniref:Uncharacterized protein LOC100372543 n=1 Tax=Saccoglossus kowalevskii TaxID=10224 RepID=A0ABM0MS77_SACKO|nr:PREDICTED: uncharacterized protein LOC100372543 [Saccoglossus kowalevskii]
MATKDTKKKKNDAAAAQNSVKTVKTNTRPTSAPLLKGNYESDVIFAEESLVSSEVKDERSCDEKEDKELKDKHEEERDNKIENLEDDILEKNENEEEQEEENNEIKNTEEDIPESTEEDVPANNREEQEGEGKEKNDVNEEEDDDDDDDDDDEKNKNEDNVKEEADDKNDTECDSISQAESESSKPTATGKSAHSSIDVRIVKRKDVSEDSRIDNVFLTAEGQNDDAITPSVDEVQAELDRVMNQQTVEDNLQQDELPGRLATLNTPATPFTLGTGSLFSESPTRSGTKQTLASLPSATKDTIYQRAMALMSTRCSSRGIPLIDTRTTDKLPLLVTSLPDHPYRHFPDSYFYVTQQRPLPAAPVKAWRGYHGNVYFEPLQCKRMETAPSLRDKSYYNSVFVKSRGSRSVTFSPKKEILNRHQYKRVTTKKPGSRQMAILDKTSVIQRMDENVQEDVRWISGLESVGSLRVGSVGSATSRSNPDRSDKMKICRGFVSHSTSPRFQNLPVVPLKGGGITHSVSKSEYLQSPYRGNSRQGLNNSNMSPELYRYPDSSPAQLDKLKASLQNMERSREMVFNIPPYPGIPLEESTPRSQKPEASDLQVTAR